MSQQYQKENPVKEPSVQAEQKKESEKNSAFLIEKIRGFVDENYNNPQLSLSLTADAFILQKYICRNCLRKEQGRISQNMLKICVWNRQKYF